MVPLPLDNWPDVTIAVPGTCNPEYPDSGSKETHRASAFGGYSATSESLELEYPFTK